MFPSVRRWQPLRSFKASATLLKGVKNLSSRNSFYGLSNCQEMMNLFLYYIMIDMIVNWISNWCLFTSTVNNHLIIMEGSKTTLCLPRIVTLQLKYVSLFYIQLWRWSSSQLFNVGRVVRIWLKGSPKGSQTPLSFLI